MSNIKIAICSVLKPINDARMYEKFGISIAETGKYDVHIIGYPATAPNHPGITFHSLSRFKRISFKRFLASWKISKIILNVKPEVIIVNSHELLVVMILHKILFGSKILYDIQENYFRNIWYQNNFPPGIKHILALSVRLKELITAPFLSYKILAEERYHEELPFVKKKAVVVRNKYNPIRKINAFKEKDPEGKLRFLYSGTVSKVYGIEEALRFFKAINIVKPSTLTIIGHCADHQLFIKLETEAKREPSIILNIDKSPIDHEKIEGVYPFIDFALTPYPYNSSTVNCLPVKFYEYIAHRIPIVAPNYNDSWIKFLSKYNAGLFINFNDFNPEKTLEVLKKRRFFQGTLQQDIYWESEKDILLNILALLKNKAS